MRLAQADHARIQLRRVDLRQLRQVVQRVALRIGREIQLVHLDDVGRVASGDRSGELVPVAVPVRKLARDVDVRVLGLEGLDGLVGPFHAGVAAPPVDAERHVARAQRGPCVRCAACGTQNPPSASSTGAGGTTDTGPPLSSGDVTLRVNWWGGDARVEGTNQAIEAFPAKYPNIHVTGEFSDWNGYWDKLATSVAGGNAPDVVQMDELYLASYAQRDTLYDLSKLSQVDTSQLDPSVVGLGKSNGTLNALPIRTTGFGIVVNDDALAQLGLTLPDADTWTWDDLSAFAKKISDASGGSAVGISPMSNGYSLRLWARQHGEELFTDGKVSISPEALAGYFQLAVDWTKSGAAASASHQAEVASVALDQSDIATGKQVLSFIQATQITAYSAAAGGAKFSLVPIPTDDANKAPYGYLKPGMYWAVSAKSEHPAEAALFVNFMINDLDAGRILGTERGIPSNPKVC